jgi:hypothetical protein
MSKNTRKPSRLHLRDTQIALVVFLCVMTLFACGVFELLIRRASAPAEISTKQLTAPTRISTKELPKHIVASVMNDPFGDLPESSKYKKPWLQIVIANWENFTESDAWLLNNYYLEQYPAAEFLTIDFMCDSSYTSEREFLQAPDYLYNPHVLFRFEKTWYEWSDQKKGTVARSNTLFTRNDYPDFGAECK